MLAGELHAMQLQIQVSRTAKVKSQPAWTSLPTERWVYMQWRKRTTSLAPKPLDTLLPASTYLHAGAWETGLARKLVGSPVWLSGSTLTSVVTTLVNTNIAAHGLSPKWQPRVRLRWFIHPRGGSLVPAGAAWPL